VVQLTITHEQAEVIRNALRSHRVHVCHKPKEFETTKHLERVLTAATQWTGDKDLTEWSNQNDENKNEDASNETNQTGDI